MTGLALRSNRFAALVLLPAALALLVGPLAAEGLFCPYDGPLAAGQWICKSWKVSAGHAASHDGQYEASAPARYEHHGLCQGQVSPIVTALDGSSAALLHRRDRAFNHSASALRSLRLPTPPSRGPPARL